MLAEHVKYRDNKVILISSDWPVNYCDYMSTRPTERGGTTHSRGRSQELGM